MQFAILTLRILLRDLCARTFSYLVKNYGVLLFCLCTALHLFRIFTTFKNKVETRNCVCSGLLEQIPMRPEKKIFQYIIPLFCFYPVSRWITAILRWTGQRGRNLLKKMTSTSNEQERKENKNWISSRFPLFRFFSRFHEKKEEDPKDQQLAQNSWPNMNLDVILHLRDRTNDSGFHLFPTRQQQIKKTEREKTLSISLSNNETWKESDSHPPKMKQNQQTNRIGDADIRFNQNLEAQASAAGN